ncbi:TIGR01212 family radical SAM protein [Vallitalea okinawensis]|uniref:TIGR01212 family radical SAM protein n=1 Tax=Vallitalea okinawensis TaxID=2078660 RepID=UPI000CFD8E5A|nr:TIGR01212 family radical SAM protein [Vallitalea okinawensis]
MPRLYRKYSDYLKEKYGEKVYKLPINLPISCPNRIKGNGCSFCGDKGAGHESLSNRLSVSEQIKTNRDYISKRYKAKKFIAYLQNYSNTYMPLEQFMNYIIACKSDGVVEIAISTRPDCINEDYLMFLDQFRHENKIEISIELGLQTVNYKTLEKINRGHTLAEFIDAVLRIKKYNFDVCAHVIMNLPWDDEDDIIEGAKIISALGIQAVKCHSLYIVKGTEMADQYVRNEIEIINCESFKRRIILFLEHLDPEIVIQRIMARAPEEETLFANWGRSWWIIKEEIEEEMVKNDTYQGKKFNYLNGKALKGEAVPF